MPTQQQKTFTRGYPISTFPNPRRNFPDTSNLEERTSGATVLGGATVKIANSWYNNNNNLVRILR